MKMESNLRFSNVNVDERFTTYCSDNVRIKEGGVC